MRARLVLLLTLSENIKTPATQIFPRGQRADCVSLLITPFPRWEYAFKALNVKLIY